MRQQETPTVWPSFSHPFWHRRCPTPCRPLHHPLHKLYLQTSSFRHLDLEKHLDQGFLLHHGELELPQQPLHWGQLGRDQYRIEL